MGDGAKVGSNAVVVREAITHRLDHGESPRDAASRGTRDVALPPNARGYLVAGFVVLPFSSRVIGADLNIGLLYVLAIGGVAAALILGNSLIPAADNPLLMLGPIGVPRNP